MTDEYNEYELADIVRMTARYLSYTEFVKDNPDLEELVSQDFFYKVCSGDNKQKNVRELKRTYLKQPTEAFEKDLASRRNAAKQMLSTIRKKKNEKKF